MDAFNPLIFEMVMLLCFGCSWPFAIAKTIRTRSVDGLSIGFMSLVLIGYLSGILYKLIVHLDGVVWLYVTNSTMIFTEMILYFKYRNGKVQRRFQEGACVLGTVHGANIIKKKDAYGC